MRIIFPSPEDEVFVNCESCDALLEYNFNQKNFHCSSCKDYTNFIDWVQQQFENICEGEEAYV